MSAVDPSLFPPAFLRLLAVVPRAVERLRASAAEGRRAMPGEGGRFLFRGHRPYRPGDDLRRVDWKVAARLDRILVRQFDAERDPLTVVWLDASASMVPLGGRVKAARVAALGCAVGVGGGGRTRLGVLSEGKPSGLLEIDHTAQLPGVLEALSVLRFHGRADLARALPPLVRRVPRRARFLLVSDLLSRADPGCLQALAGRDLRGALLHLRVPAIPSPEPGGGSALQDAETGEVKRVDLDAAMAGRIAERAKAHADRWAHRAASVGLRYLPFAPSTPDEDLLRRLVEEVP